MSKKNVDKQKFQISSKVRCDRCIKINKTKGIFNSKTK